MRSALGSAVVVLPVPLLLLLALPAAAWQAVGSASGSVLDSFGDPVAGVAVEAESLSGYRTAVTSGSDGRYRFPALVSGPYTFRFSRAGYLPRIETIEVRATAPAVMRLVLYPEVPSRLSGIVLDPQGLALPGVTLEVSSPVSERQVLVTDSAGRFTVGDVRPGWWRVAASLLGFTSEVVSVDVAFGRVADISISLALDYELAEEVVVVGSRRQTEQRTVSDSSVPVDVLLAEDLVSQPRTDMAELLRTLAPSFNVNTQPISDAATVVRPTNLRNLAPDHLLVLVNGKRRHRAAVIAWLGNGISDGSQGPDISSIPPIAVRQAELLRDGAAAQYGSDAIAGVVNFRLKDAASGGSVVLSTGSCLTPNTGDPATCGAQAARGGFVHSCSGIGGRAQGYSFAGNVGLPLGSSGFANLSLEYGGSDPTNRAVQREDARQLVEAGNPFVRDTAQVWGLPHVMDDLKAFANFGGRVGAFTPYGHVSYARRTVDGGFYYRHPYTRGGVFQGPGFEGYPSLLVGDRLAAETGGARSAGCPPIPVIGGQPDAAALAAVGDNPDCFTLHSRFPGGFAPQFGGTVFDGSVVAGVRYLRPSGLGWDLSASVGRSRINQVLTHSVNASLGPGTPTEFQPGTSEQTEAGVNFDLTVPLARGFHFAAGAEFRNEAFRLGGGDAASWAIGPYADQGFSSGSNGFNGYRPDTAAGHWDRSNIAAYVDLEHRPEDGRWTLGGALRLERFEDFGPTLNGKLSARLRLTEPVSLRAAASTGFRAATPGQQHAFNVTTAFIGGRLVNRGVVPATSAVAIARGGRQLQPERSVHYSVGVVGQLPRMQVRWGRVRRHRVGPARAVAGDSPDSVRGRGPSRRGYSRGEELPGVPLLRQRLRDHDARLRSHLGPPRRRGHRRRDVQPHVDPGPLALGRVIDDYRVHTLARGLPEYRGQPGRGRGSGAGRSSPATTGSGATGTARTAATLRGWAWSPSPGSSPPTPAAACSTSRSRWSSTPASRSASAPAMCFPPGPRRIRTRLSRSETATGSFRRSVLTGPTSTAASTTGGEGRSEFGGLDVRRW